MSKEQTYFVIVLLVSTVQRKKKPPEPDGVPSKVLALASHPSRGVLASPSMSGLEGWFSTMLGWGLVRAAIPNFPRLAGRLRKEDHPADSPTGYRLAVLLDEVKFLQKTVFPNHRASREPESDKTVH
ncbi:hypothetical protein ACJJTC_016184 [Scirpophaga incertulas]